MEAEIALKFRSHRVVAATVIGCVAIGLLFVPTLAAAARWIPPADLSTQSEFTPFGPRPEIAMDAAGGAIAVWPQLEGFENVQAASMSPAGIWGPPVDLAPSVYDQDAPQVAMNAS